MSDAETVIDGEGGGESDNEFIMRLGGDNKDDIKTVDEITRAFYVVLLSDIIVVILRSRFFSEWLKRYLFHGPHNNQPHCDR